METMMCKDDAGYFNQRDRATRVSSREQFSAPEFRRRASTLHRPDQMPWPTNQFGEPASIVELVVGAAQPSERAGENSVLTMRDHADVT
jgi:hypothetical protein